MKRTFTLLTAPLLAPLGMLHAAEFRVSACGNDANSGTKVELFATLERARAHIER